MFSEITLYPHSVTAGLDPARFENPPAAYRGAPFWSWNNRLSIPQLIRQIHQMKGMGFGGFYMHPRTGLDTVYLGDEFMAAVKACVDEARSQGMLALIYDEDRWPSGYAGSLVTRDNLNYRAKQLLWTCTPYAPRDAASVEPDGHWTTRNARTECGDLIAVYAVRLDDDGRLVSQRVAPDSEEAHAEGRLWYAYIETERPFTWFHGATYVDTLKPEAIRRFIEVTHERYADVVGEEFGRTIRSIFTDEPEFVHKQAFRTPWDTHDLVMPFTDDLLESFARTYGQRLEDHLPELFWELPGGGSSVARYRYHDHVCERFTEAFADQIGAWCEAHGVALTGHMMEEPTLLSQTNALGEAMRSYRSFQIPGIDMLCDRREYNTAKQAQSAARQYGRCGVTSELYGVTNWDYPFSGHKSQGDWQAALGVTARVPHLTWVSMAGDAKRDYPASIGYQSPWFTEYPLIEDHFARVGSVMTLGDAVVRVGVIHPIESYWLVSGPREQTSLARQELETDFANLTEWLLFGLVDFDFIAESLLPELCPDVDGIGEQLQVGKMRYDAILVPNLRTIRSSTLARLERFAASGGRVILLGDEAPGLVDGAQSEAARDAAARWQRVPCTRPRILEALADLGEIAAQMPSGDPATTLLYQMRSAGDQRYVFVCNADQNSIAAMATEAQWLIKLRLRGAWSVQVLETMTGERLHVPSSLVRRLGETWTEIQRPILPGGSLLLELMPRSDSEPDATAAAPTVWRELARLPDPMAVTLSEPNVLLLDRAEYRFDNSGDWLGPEEVLRIENLYRQAHGLPMMTGSNVQPWTDTAPAPIVGEIALGFTIASEIEIPAPSLALEDGDRNHVTVNGVEIPTGPDHATGYFVDEAIQVFALPDLPSGVSTIEIHIPFTRKSKIEACYLLGDFGVTVAGSHGRIIAPVRTLVWGDWTRQGLPFYAGNVTYHAKIGVETAENKRFALHVPHFASPLLSVSAPMGGIGKIAFAPYRLELTDALQAADGGGKLGIDITAYGTRVNTFGALHNCNPGEKWFGPPAWRTEGTAWSDEYQLRPAGILVAPMICAAAPPRQ